MYHGCSFRNRNGTRKLIDYKRGQNCVLATDECCWKIKKKNIWLKKVTIHEKEEENY